MLVVFNYRISRVNLREIITTPSLENRARSLLWRKKRIFPHGGLRSVDWCLEIISIVHMEHLKFLKARDLHLEKQIVVVFGYHSILAFHLGKEYFDYKLFLFYFAT